MGKLMKKIYSLIFLTLYFFLINAASAQDAYQQQDASAYAKMVEVEEELRRVRGQLEENVFQHQKLVERMNKLQEDIEFRLGRLEKTVPSAGVELSAAQPEENIYPEPTTPPANTNNAPPSMVSGGKGEQKILGTVKIRKDEKPADLAKPIVDPNPKPLSPKDQYNNAFQLLRDKKLPEAISTFEDFISKNPKHELAGNALYWIGEALYVQKNYNEAAGNFLKVYKKYPKNQKAPDSLLKLSMSLAALDKKKEACTTLSELSEKYSSMSSSLKQKASAEKKRLGCK